MTLDTIGRLWYIILSTETFITQIRLSPTGIKLSAFFFCFNRMYPKAIPLRGFPHSYLYGCLTTVHLDICLDISKTNTTFIIMIIHHIISNHAPVLDDLR